MKIIILLTFLITSITTHAKNLEIFIKLKLGNCTKCYIINNNEIESLKKNFKVSFLIDNLDSLVVSEFINNHFKYLNTLPIIYSEKLYNQITEETNTSINLISNPYSENAEILYSILPNQISEYIDKFDKLSCYFYPETKKTYNLPKLSQEIKIKQFDVSKSSYFIHDEILNKLYFIDSLKYAYKEINFGNLNDSLILSKINSDTNFINENLKIKLKISKLNLPISSGTFGSIYIFKDTVYVCFSYNYYVNIKENKPNKLWRSNFLLQYFQGKIISYHQIKEELNKKHVSIENSGLYIQNNLVFLRNRNGLNHKKEKNNISVYEINNFTNYSLKNYIDLKVPFFLKKNQKKGYDFMFSDMNDNTFYYKNYPFLYDIVSKKNYEIKNLIPQEYDYEILNTGIFPYLNIYDAKIINNQIFIVYKKDFESIIKYQIFDIKENKCISIKEIGELKKIKGISINNDATLTFIKNGNLFTSTKD